MSLVVVGFLAVVVLLYLITIFVLGFCRCSVGRLFFSNLLPFDVVFRWGPALHGSGLYGTRMAVQIMILLLAVVETYLLLSLGAQFENSSRHMLLSCIT